MSNEFSFLDAVAQADLVRRGEVSPEELVSAAIAGIEEVDPEINAVIHPLFEEGLERARGALPEGPFRGVPFLFKDLDVPLAGAPFHAGMELLKSLGHRAKANSHFSDSILAAGFIPIGRTNTPELGLTVSTEPAAYGPTRNPWNLEHSAGGSSGGSAAAVAARMVSIAHASDGGGSIRIPASECGLVGLKPSRGRVSLGPQYGEYWNGLVGNHVVSVSVRDTACLLDCVAGAHPGDPYGAPPPLRPFQDEPGRDPGKLRIGLLNELPGRPGQLDPQCVAAVSDAGRLLEELGHEVALAYPAPLDRHEEQMGAFLSIVGAWVASSLNEWGTEVGREITEADVEPGTWILAQAGLAQTSAMLVDQLKWLGRFTHDMAQWWESGFDLLLTPTLGVPPPRLGWLSVGEDSGAAMGRVLSVMPFTAPFNLTGQPAVSLPLFWSDQQLPVGIQLVAATGRDDLLLRLAAQLEQARPWADRRPPTCVS